METYLWSIPALNAWLQRAFVISLMSQRSCPTSLIIPKLARQRRIRPIEISQRKQRLASANVREWNISHAYRIITYDKSILTNPWKYNLRGFPTLDPILFTLEKYIITTFTALEQFQPDFNIPVICMTYVPFSYLDSPHTHQNTIRPSQVRNGYCGERVIRLSHKLRYESKQPEVPSDLSGGGLDRLFCSSDISEWVETMSIVRNI